MVKEKPLPPEPYVPRLDHAGRVETRISLVGKQVEFESQTGDDSGVCRDFDPVTGISLVQLYSGRMVSVSRTMFETCENLRRKREKKAQDAIKAHAEALAAEQTSLNGDGSIETVQTLDHGVVERRLERVEARAGGDLPDVDRDFKPQLGPAGAGFLDGEDRFGMIANKYDDFRGYLKDLRAKRVTRRPGQSVLEDLDTIASDPTGKQHMDAMDQDAIKAAARKAKEKVMLGDGGCSTDGMSTVTEETKVSAWSYGTITRTNDARLKAHFHGADPLTEVNRSLVPEVRYRTRRKPRLKLRKRLLAEARQAALDARTSGRMRRFQGYGPRIGGTPADAEAAATGAGARALEGGGGGEGAAAGSAGATPGRSSSSSSSSASVSSTFPGEEEEAVVRLGHLDAIDEAESLAVGRRSTAPLAGMTGMRRRHRPPPSGGVPVNEWGDSVAAGAGAGGALDALAAAGTGGAHFETDGAMEGSGGEDDAFGDYGDEEDSDAGLDDDDDDDDPNVFDYVFPIVISKVGQGDAETRWVPGSDVVIAFNKVKDALRVQL